MRKLFTTSTLLLAACLSFENLPAQKEMSYQAMQDKFQAEQADNKGYVWTISVQSETNLELEGLAKVDCQMNGSLSHVGSTMNGIYGGELKLNSQFNLSGLEELLALIGGTLSVEADGNEVTYLCPEIYFDIHSYNAAEDEQWKQHFASAGNSLDQSAVQQLNAMSNMMAKDFAPRQKAFERTSKPLSFGAISNTKITGTDEIKANLDLNNGYYGISINTSTITGGNIVDGEAVGGIMDRDPTNVTILPGLLGIRRHVEGKIEAIENSLPMMVRIYPENLVVFELYSSTGGPFVAKFYGVIDRIPVGQTITATKAIAQNMKREGSTDDRSDIEERLAEKKRLAEEESQAQAKAEAEEKAAQEAEFTTLWNEHLSIFPRWEAGGSNFRLEDMGEGAWSMTLDTDVDNTGNYIEQLLKAGFLSIDGNYGPWFKNIDGHYHAFWLDNNDGSFDEEEKTVHVYFNELDDDSLISRAKEIEKKKK